MIRKATVDDAKAIAEVHVESWKSAYKGIISDEYLSNLKVDDRLSLWVTSLSVQNEKAPVYVAVSEEGKIIGFSSFGFERERKKENEGELYAIYLLKEMKHKRVGTHLFHSGVKELIKHNFQSVRVWVLANNSSVKFYEKFDPKKVEVKTIQIGDAFHEEIAFQWDNIHDLLRNLEYHLNN